MIVNWELVPITTDLHSRIWKKYKSGTRRLRYRDYQAVWRRGSGGINTLRVQYPRPSGDIVFKEVYFADESSAFIEMILEATIHDLRKEINNGTAV